VLNVAKRYEKKKRDLDYSIVPSGVLVLETHLETVPIFFEIICKSIRFFKYLYIARV